MSLIIRSRMLVVDLNGKPLIGAKMFVYDVNTTDIKDIWLDKGFTVPSANPVISVTTGYFPTVYVSGEHKLVFKTSADATISTDDFVEAATVASATTTAEGVVQFATVSEVAAQTPGKVIDSGDTGSIPITAGNISGELAVGNIPDLPATKITSLTFDPARLPVATETAIGAVEKATSAEVTAGTADKFIDAALLQGALSIIATAVFTGAGNKYIKIAADTGTILIQWDTEPVNANTSTNITLDQTYADTTYAIFVTADDASESRSENNGAVVISSSVIQLWSGDSSVNSLFWFTIGKAV